VIRVLIADDQAIARQGLHIILSAENDIEVVGQAHDGQEAVDMTAKRQDSQVYKPPKSSKRNFLAPPFSSSQPMTWMTG
jgi:CheY-like chemotaxis protein